MFIKHTSISVSHRNHSTVIWQTFWQIIHTNMLMASYSILCENYNLNAKKYINCFTITSFAFLHISCCGVMSILWPKNVNNNYCGLISEAKVLINFYYFIVFLVHHMTKQMWELYVPQWKYQTCTRNVFTLWHVFLMFMLPSCCTGCLLVLESHGI